MPKKGRAHLRKNANQIGPDLDLGLSLKISLFAMALFSHSAIGLFNAAFGGEVSRETGEPVAARIVFG
jgi:hypothetical protein